MPRPATPMLRHREACTQLVVDDKPFLVIGGELRNSSASTPADIRRNFANVARLGLNTVLAPLTWETVEAEEGAFDFTLLDTMLHAAREGGLRLIPLWFGTYKNASSSYAPAWVKRDQDRFPRAHLAPGRSGTAISPLSADAAEADARAFAAVMRHLRDVDADRHTVIMVQVENEPGILGVARDRSPAAEEAFAGAVPAELLDGLAAIAARDGAELSRRLTLGGGPGRQAWADVFGDGAEEVFMAWHVAGFLEHVAQAGRAAYDLPLFANAWIKAGPGYKPGEYPSGGPTAEMLDVYRVAAPTLDLIAPDIYHDHFREICAAYASPRNPLLVPESRPDASAGGRLLYVLGEHRGIGLCPFAVDELTDPAHPLAETAAAVRAMVDVIAEAQARGDARAVFQQAEGETHAVDLGGVRFTASPRFPHDPAAPANAAMLLRLGDDGFIAVGQGLRIDLAPADDDGTTVELLEAFEGGYADGEWQPGRRLNGDETDHGTRVLLSRTLHVIRFRTFRYR